MRRFNRSKQRGKTTPSELDLVRQFYAEELRAVANLQSEAVVRAFAKVPREHFLGAGPWRVFSPGSKSDWTTKDADPTHLYHNLLVVIDEERHLNNGHPGFLAFLIEQLELKDGQRAVHVGCGTGYYTAIIAEVVGREGHVTAIEIDTQLAGRARNNLSYFANVEVIEGDGGEIDAGPADAILVNAGATHLRSIWLDSLRPHGRLIMPLTVIDDTERGGEGRILKVTRQSEGFTASLSRKSESSLASEVGMATRTSDKESLERDDWKLVQSLRREPHEPADSCWFHGRDFCLSKLPVMNE